MKRWKLPYKSALSLATLSILALALVSSKAPAQSFIIAQSTVPGGGPGPVYTYKVSKYEITNQQYADFLNNAQLDGGSTARSSNMAFQANGQVTTTSGALMFKPFPASRIIHIASSPIGMRYVPEAGMNTQPVIHASWIGAAKFCNWLTIDQGIGEDQRVYTEGPNAVDWHPATISTADWIVRDLNELERQALIDDYVGFRLPMDNVGLLPLGFIGGQENAFNEWYQMAAYDPLAPDTTRSGPGDEFVSPDHWAYGVGRDTLVNNAANFLMSGDPFEFTGTSPTGYYNGANSGTVDTSNPYRIYDLSGNAAEWMQDQAGSLSGRAIRGGSWNTIRDLLAASYRTSAPLDMTNPDVGFRVVHLLPAPPMPDGDFNHDGLVNLTDYQSLRTCMLGPAAPYDTDGLHTVTVGVGPGFSYSPPNSIIEVGDTIHWDWMGGTHNVTSGSGGIHDGNFYSGPATGNTNFFFEVTFSETFLDSHPMPNNTYPFYCEPHWGFGMMGSIHVNRDPCFPFDFDGDGNIDLADYAAFAASFRTN